MRPASLVSIHRYPVKGFSAETLADVELTEGRFFPGDRLYAVENGPSGFDPAAPQYKDKTSFLVLMRNARIAALKTRFDQDSHVFSLTGPDGSVAGDLRTPDGRAQVETFLTVFMGEAARGPLKVLAAPEATASPTACARASCPWSIWPAFGTWRRAWARRWTPSASA